MRFRNTTHYDELTVIDLLAALCDAGEQGKGIKILNLMGIYKKSYSGVAERRVAMALSQALEDERFLPNLRTLRLPNWESMLPRNALGRRKIIISRW
jgi:hypothetical protein